MVLKKTINEDTVRETIDSKKTNPFKSLLKKPKKEEVHVHSLKLYYECITTISGRYIADYYRKGIHTISVDFNVKEVVLGDYVFTTKARSGFKKALARKHSKNKINLKLEEHVFVDEQDEISLDHHGHIIKSPFAMTSNAMENYPKKILSKNKQNVRRLEITTDVAVSHLKQQLQKPLDSDVRDLTEEFELQGIVETYVPIFEARLVGPRKKVHILRIDAVHNKIF